MEHNILSAKRVGTSNGTRPRVIIVQMDTVQNRDTIIKQAKIIKRNANYPKLWLSKDVTDNRKRTQNYLRESAKRLKKKFPTENIKVVGHAVQFRGSNYTWTELNNLPKGCRLEDLSTKYISEEKAIFFGGEGSPLSMMYPTDIFDKGLMFSSGEQMFQSSKAVYHNKTDINKLIMQEKDPYEIKKLSKRIRTSKEWSEIEKSELERITRLKFNQNRNIRDKWLVSDIKNHYEATADKKFGSGNRIWRVPFDKDKFIQNGCRNEYGKILDKLYKEMSQESDIKTRAGCHLGYEISNPKAEIDLNDINNFPELINHKA